MIVAASLHYLIHWPTQGGYNFVSGPLSDITLITAFAGTLYVFVRKHTVTSSAVGGWRGTPIQITGIRCVGSTTQTGTVCLPSGLLLLHAGGTEL